MLEQIQGVPWVLIRLAHQISSTWPSHGWDLPWWLPAGSLSLLQGIFPTQESNPGLLHCRQILYQVSHKGSLVVVSGGYSLVVCGLLIAVTSRCSSRTLEHRLSSCGTWAQFPPGVWHLPRPDWTGVSCIGRQMLYHGVTTEALLKPPCTLIKLHSLLFPWYFVVVQLLSHVQLFATPWTAGCQASLSFTISQILLKLMSIDSMMPSNHLLLCCPFSSCP